MTVLPCRDRCYEQVRDWEGVRQWLGGPGHDLIVCCSVWSLFLSPSVGKKYALNQVEFTEVQESGNHLQSSTSAEVTYGFQCENFLAWVGTSFLAISGFRENIFMFSHTVMENSILFSTQCILHHVLTVFITQFLKKICFKSSGVHRGAGVGQPPAIQHLCRSHLRFSVFWFFSLGGHMFLGNHWIPRKHIYVFLPISPSSWKNNLL